MKRYQWRPPFVSATKVPESHVRAYLEFQHLRRVLDLLPPDASSRPAADVGAGYGRLTQVLVDVFEGDVVAFEREPKLVIAGQRLVPKAAWYCVRKLVDLPFPPALFGFAMAFTVLQHMTHEQAAKAIAAMRRLVRDDGYVLIVEDSDPRHEHVDPNDEGHFCLGRSVRWYRERMSGWRLLHISRREMEPGYRYGRTPRPFVGHYMLFAGPGVTG